MRLWVAAFHVGFIVIACVGAAAGVRRMFYGPGRPLGGAWA